MDSGLNDPLPPEPSVPQRPPCNPWFTIWLQPRETMREILDRDPIGMVILLAVLGGIAQSLDKAIFKNMGDKFSLSIVLAFCLVIGPIGGLLSLYLGSFLLKWTGSWIGGKGSAQEIRAALAWSNIPIIWALVIVIPEILLFGKELFQANTPVLNSSPVLKILFILFSIADFIIGIWSCLITLKCLAEAQRFSAWKALLNLVLPFLLFLILVLILLLPLLLKS